MGQAICPLCHLTNSDGNAITVCGQAHKPAEKPMFTDAGAAPILNSSRVSAKLLAWPQSAGWVHSQFAKWCMPSEPASGPKNRRDCSVLQAD